MPNFLQKWLYNLSAGAPLLIVFAIVWYCEKRTWIVAYISSYILPFASMALDDYNFLLFFAIAAAIVILAPFANSAVPNPLLALGRYHFYQITAENGVSGYVLISKRKIRSAKDVKRVNRVFEFLLEDVEGI